MSDADSSILIGQNIIFHYKISHNVVEMIPHFYLSRKCFKSSIENFVQHISYHSHFLR